MAKAGRISVMGAGALMLLWAPSVMAQPAHAALSGLAECSALPEPAGRAACYDRAYEALNQQLKSGELSIIAKKEARAAQRGAFGLDLPSLAIFDRAAGTDAPLERVTEELARAYQDGGGRWVFELKDAAVWRQTDNEPIQPKPRAGAAVEIRKAALGSYFLKVGEARGVRAKRSQ